MCSLIMEVFKAKSNGFTSIDKNSIWNQLPKPNLSNWSRCYSSPEAEPSSSTWVEKRVKINVGGQRFQTLESTLRRFPATLLGSDEKEKYFDTKMNEYFFDRDPSLFRHILNFYRKGKMHFSQLQCGLPYDEELSFYGIDPRYIGHCCRDEYQSTFLGDEVGNCEIQSMNEDSETPEIVLAGTVREKLYTIFKYPQVNCYGKLTLYLIEVAIVISVITTIVETISCGDMKCGDKYSEVFKYIDGCCVFIFLVEFVVRCYASKDRIKHLRSLNTVIDALAILPFFVNIILNSISHSSNPGTQALVTLRVFRIFRVFKLMRISERLQFLGRSLKASAPDLLFLCFTILIGVLIFSTIIFFTEQIEGHSKFPTIPAAMWFGAQTMTTLGYGDVTPATTIGKFVAAIFCLGGILVIALPVPVIEMKQKLTAQYERSCKRRRRKIKRTAETNANEVTTTECSKNADQITTSV